MINALPVIGVNSGGARDLIKNEYNGFVFSPGNENELADKMSRFLENKKLIKELGKNAFISVSDNFTIEKTSEQIYHVYEDCLKSIYESYLIKKRSYR